MSTTNDLYNVTLHNFEQHNTMNKTIANRNFPSNNLAMNFSFRPVNTKYTLMPTYNHQIESSVPINNREVYDVNSTFFPGTRKPHFCGFATNVDRESTLRNQFFALQKADQVAYVPNSSSDLYENNINFPTHNANLDALLLFKEESFNDFNPNISNSIGNEIFYNSTRVQLKDLK
jgi:hypothetical protein